MAFLEFQNSMLGHNYLDQFLRFERDSNYEYGHIFDPNRDLPIEYTIRITGNAGMKSLNGTTDGFHISDSEELLVRMDVLIPWEAVIKIINQNLGHLLGNIILEGNDILLGADAVGNTLYGYTGDDYIVGGDLVDDLSGDAGDDILIGGLGNDILNGGKGFDFADYSSAVSAITANLAAGAVSTNGDTDELVLIEGIVGSDFDDQIFGDAADNILRGGDGDDRLDGLAGDDELDGGAGADRLAGRDGADLLIGGAGADRLTGGNGADRMAGGDGNDIYDVDNVGDVVTERAGEGKDRINTSVDYTSPENVEFLVGKFAPTGLNLTGNSGRDRITGANQAQTPDTIHGMAGNDFIAGLVGDDVLSGGDGDDRIFGNSGADVIDGGAGDDLVTGQFGADRFVLGVNQGEDRINDFDVNGDFLDLRAHGFADFAAVQAIMSDAMGGALLDFAGPGSVLLEGVAAASLGQEDVLIAPSENGVANATAGAKSEFNYLTGIHAPVGLTMVGDAGRDWIVGANKMHSPDTISGVGGDDRLIGMVGDDVISGGEGDDRIFGNSGMDIITGGLGDDRVTGQQNADTFVHVPGDGRDWVTDFDVTEDLLDLTAHGFSAFADVQALLSDVASGALLDLAGVDNIFLENVSSATIGQDNVSL